MGRIKWVVIALIWLAVGFAGGFVFQTIGGVGMLSSDNESQAETDSADVATLKERMMRLHGIPEDPTFSFEDMGRVYQQSESRYLNSWLGEQFDEETCNQRAEWAIDYDLETWDEQTNPYYEAFVDDGLGGYFPQADIEVIHREQVQETDSYTVDYLVTTTRGPDTNVRAYVMIPKAPPPEDGYPVVILLHASNNLIESVVGLYDGQDRTNTAGVRWAERGAVVIAIDGLDNPAIAVMETARLVDRNGYFLIIQRIHSIIDWVTTQTEIPVNRIATYGISYGGYMSFWAGLTDDRVDVVAANGFARDFTEWIFTNPTTYPEPMLRNSFEYMDWCTWEMSTQARFIAPRRLLIEVGDRDKSTLIGDFGSPRTAPEPVDSSVFDHVVERIQTTYDQLGIGDRFKGVIFEGGHEMLSRDSEDWIFAQLTRPADMP